MLKRTRTIAAPAGRSRAEQLEELVARLASVRAGVLNSDVRILCGVADRPVLAHGSTLRATGEGSAHD